MDKPVPGAHRITSEEELEALYGKPMPMALTKELDHISDHYRLFIEKSPFVVLASAGPEGLDASPRGDPAPIVRVVDNKTVMLPDRRGNGRIDSLRNIVRDGRVALLFIIPGLGETLRINGRAELSTDPELCASFEMQGKAPRTVVIVHVEACYYQCPKAFVRAKLWNPDSYVDRKELPSNGEMIKALAPDFDAETYDKNYPQRVKDTIY